MRTDKEKLKEIIFKNGIVAEILYRAEKVNLPNWYLGAGCIAQTVWNYFHDYELNNNINDYDLVYFDENEMSYEAEDLIIEKVKDEFRDLHINLDVKNQARVHLWYKEHFGYSIKPYNNIEDAISSWPTTSTSIGIKIINDKLVYYAPFGINDLMNMTVRANKKQITMDIYEGKIERWKKCWPKLNIIEW